MLRIDILYIYKLGKAAYIERNRVMINNRCFRIVYYDKAAIPTTRKSGTKSALDYAVKKGKAILTFPTQVVANSLTQADKL